MEAVTGDRLAATVPPSSSSPSSSSVTLSSRRNSSVAEKPRDALENVIV